MPLSWGQKLVAESPMRFRVVCAGRRWGKTHFALREIAKHAAQPDQLCYYVAPSYKMAKNIMWKKIKRKLGNLNWVRKVNETELSLELVNGSIIMLKGADNFDSLRGVGLNFLCMDEVADIDPAAWYEVLRPTLSDTGGRALLIGTPKGLNYFKDLFDNAQTKPGWMSWQFTTLDGGNVPEEEIQQARQDLDERTFKQEYEASFENFSGIIAYAFGSHNIKDAEAITASEPLIVSMDFNVSPMSAVILKQTRQGLHAIDEIALYGSNTNEMIDEIRNRYPRNPITCFPDPAGVQRKTSANGQTDIKLLEMAGFTVRYHRQHPLVKDRINAANSLFHLRDDNTTRFFIDPKCKHTIKSLQQFCYKEGTQVPDKDSGYDHFFDALTYCIEFLYPIRKEQEKIVPQRFGHQLA